MLGSRCSRRVPASLVAVGGLLLVTAGARRALPWPVAALTLQTTDTVEVSGVAVSPLSTEATTLAVGPRGTVCVAESIPVDKKNGVSVFASFDRVHAGGPFCIPWVAVLSQEGVAILEAPPWTDNNDHLHITLSAPVVLPVNVWVVTTAASATTDIDFARTTVSHADALFKDSWGALTLLQPTAPPVGEFGKGVQGQVTAVLEASNEAGSIGTSCTSVPLLRARGTPVYRPDSLNVYFVPEIRFPGGWYQAAYNCFEYGAPNVIYVAMKNEQEFMLAHEIGHALGLQYGSGHVRPKDGFSPHNPMRGGITFTKVVLPETFTPGQIIRTQVDISSWLNRWVKLNGAAMPVRGNNEGVVVACQDSPTVAVPCPALNK